MARWIFYGWDEVHFRRLRGVLRRAALSGALPADLSGPGRAALQELPAGASLEEACNAIFLAECARGEAAVCEGGLPELLVYLRRDDAGEEFATAIAELISARPHMEAWFETEVGLIGLLSAADVRAIADSANRVRSEPRLPQRPSWLRRLSPAQDPYEGLMDLMDLVVWSAEQGLGLAAVLEE